MRSVEVSSKPGAIQYLVLSVLAHRPSGASDPQSKLLGVLSIHLTTLHGMTRRSCHSNSSADQGYLHCGQHGAGNFVKMVCNGTAYGVMDAYAEGFFCDKREFYLVNERPHEETLYERLLGGAIDGNGTLFTREDAVGAAWAVVEPVLSGCD